jgi:drug/metabolite transporter (DMT)-like permease
VWYFIGLVAAVLLGAGFVLQQDAAQRVPQSDFLRLRLVADLLRQPRWLAGLGIMIAGQLLGAWVIGHMVLALSEPLLATNLLFALIIAGRVSGQPARLRELIGAVILLAGVSALSVARAVTSVQDSVGSPAYWPYVGAAIGAIAACFAIAGRRRQGELRALLTGIAAGLVLGIQDALTRVTVRRLGSVHDAAALLISWPAYSLVAVGIIALWLMQSAFSSAPLHASLPGVTAAEPVSGIVLGIVAFREKVPASPLLIAVQVAGLIALVAGVILVARSPVLASLRQYHGPGEHLLHRDRDRGRNRDRDPDRDRDRGRDPDQERDRDLEQQRPRPGAGPGTSPGLIRPGLINPGPASPGPARGPDLAPPPGSLRRRRGGGWGAPPSGPGVSGR